MTIQWISEADALPRIGQAVLLAAPRQMGEFWDLVVVSLLVRHEGVVAQPIAPGSRWPSEYYWGTAKSASDIRLITGNAYWADLKGLSLPPGAEHRSINGYDIVAQTGQIFVPQKNGGAV